VRLLFDEQLSEELIVLLQDVFPDSLHVRQLGALGLGGSASGSSPAPGSSPASVTAFSSRKTKTLTA